MLLINIVLLLYFHSLNASSIKLSELGPTKVIFNINEADEIFEDFVDTYDKKYSDDTEYKHRCEIFKSNLVKINKLNQRTSSAVFSINELSDLSTEEIVGNFTMEDVVDDEHVDNGTIEKLNLRSATNVPKEWDWRKKNVVTPAKNQGRCLSCWAFAAVACIESQHAIKTNKLIPLSQQQLVDCLGQGCKPYYPDLAMREVAARMGGLMTYADYPYESNSGRDGKCRCNKNRVAVQIKGGRTVHSIRNEKQLEQLIHKYGPVVAAIHATSAFCYYRSGIATAESLNCPRNAIPNHAVVIVGYGTENNVPYWIVKNSGGISWGENGYARLLRGRNVCSILRYISIAEL